MDNAINYDGDFYGWAMQQAHLLRAGQFSELDADNLAQEVEDMAKRERRELLSRLTVLLTHLLKWQFQLGRQSRSWRLTIEEQRIQLRDHLAENPSLAPTIDELVSRAYRRARLAAERETGLSSGTFPLTSPFTFAQTTDDEFWP